MMKKVLLVLGIMAAAAVVSGWSQHSKVAAAVSEGCAMTESGDATQCACIGNTVSSDLSFVSFAGLGPLRPLMPKAAEMQDLVLDAMSTCSTA